MSKFIKKVKSRFLNREAPLVDYMSTTLMEKEAPEIPRTTMLQNYEIGVEWKVNVWCEPENLDRLVDRSIHQLRRDIYGDLEDLIFKLQQAVYSWDREQIRRIIEEIIVEVRG